MSRLTKEIVRYKYANPERQLSFKLLNLAQSELEFRAIVTALQSDEITEKSL